MAKLRIVFMGTGDIALSSLRSLLVPDDGAKSKSNANFNSEPVSYELLALVTQPDKPVGRKQVLTAPAIKELAQDHGIPVMQPESAREKSFLEALEAMQPDVIVVMAYGQILSQALLDIASVACINLHASLLPKYRGAACIQAAIDAGDSHTGITVMHVVKALDAGDIILSGSLAPLIPVQAGDKMSLEIAGIAATQVVEYRDLSLLAEITCQVGADEAGSSSDEDTLAHACSMSACMAGSCASIDSTSLNWVRQRSRLCVGRLILK